jgi:hypothetical protein
VAGERQILITLTNEVAHVQSLEIGEFIDQAGIAISGYPPFVGPQVCDVVLREVFAENCCGASGDS